MALLWLFGRGAAIGNYRLSTTSLATNSLGPKMWHKRQQPLLTPSRVQQRQRRLISSHLVGALRIIGLPTTQDLSVVTLRQAYFTAAKKCHPDVSNRVNSCSSKDDFLELTAAYEFLLAHIGGTMSSSANTIISMDEELEFRQACREQLGISAELVEECKQNPMFRKWLSGRTDGAQHWRQFFLQNGGLAPKLRSKLGLMAGDSAAGRRRTVRRRRR